MKYLLTLVVIGILITANAQITWTPPISVAMSHYSNLRPRIVTDRSGNPIVIWGKQSSQEVNCSRWNGSAFTMPVVLNPMSTPIFTDSWAGPEMASFGDTLYVVFKETPEDTNRIYAVSSYDGGLTFTSPVAVDTVNSVSRFPTVTTNDNGHPIVGYMKFEPGFMNPQYVVSTSTNLGNSYGFERLAGGFSGGEACDCCPGAVVAKGSDVAMLYRDNLNDIRNIWAGISHDAGASFSTGVQIDESDWLINTCPSTGPDAIIVGDTVYTVFMSRGTGARLIYLSKLALGSGESDKGSFLTGSFAGLTLQNYPRIAHQGAASAITWKQRVGTSDEIALAFTKNISQGFTTVYDTIAQGGILVNSDVALSPGVIHAVWQDETSGTVMYRKGTYTQDSVATGLPIEQTAHTLGLFPNPASSTVLLHTKEAGNVEVHDAHGKLVLSSMVSGEQDTYLNVQNLANGVYQLTFRGKDGLQSSERLYIQH